MPFNLPGARLRRAAAHAVILAFCFAAWGCFYIEQEIFLNADGSGQLVIHLSFPDIPEEMTAGAPPEAARKDPRLQMEQAAKELAATLPPTVKVKEMKESRQNGSLAYYVILEFKRLEDLQDTLRTLGKSTVVAGEPPPAPEAAKKSDPFSWTARLEKRGERTFYEGSFFMDISDVTAEAGAASSGPNVKAEVKITPKAQEPGPRRAGPPPPKEPEPQPDAVGMDQLGKQMSQLLLGIIKLRFVLHAPSPILESNADIVLNQRTAIWNCSPIGFIKNNKPIQMKATF